MKRELSEQEAIIAAKRKYYKEWRSKNRERIAIYNQEYWKKRAQKMMEDDSQEQSNE